MPEAYPLQWPPAYPRTKYRTRSQFKTTFGKARDGILHELHLMGVPDSKVIISSNVPLRRDGLPHAGHAEPRDPGVAVYFTWKGQQRVLACDRWDRIADNLRAIEKAIEAMRGLSRWGVSEILERAFTGFTALPAPEQWWDVLDLNPDVPLVLIENRYRHLMKENHPDNGGSEGKAAKLNWAIAEARRAKGAQ